MEQATAPSRSKPAWWLLGILLALSGVFIGLLISGNVKWSPDFQPATIIRVEGVSDPELAAEQMESALQELSVVGIAENMLLVEIPRLTDLPENLESLIEGEIEVTELGPLFRYETFHSFLTAVAMAMVALGVALLIITRRKRVAWVVPLVTGSSVGGALGIYTIVGLPLDSATMVGAMLGILYMLAIQAKLLHRPSKAAERERGFLEDFELNSLVVLLVGFAPALLVNLAWFFALLLLLGVIGYLSTVLVVRPAVAVKPAYEVARYHVSL
jgi:hypothetical protein